MPDAIAEDGQPVRGRFSTSNAFAGSQRTPTPAARSAGRTLSVSRACAKSPCDSIQTSTPCGRAVSPEAGQRLRDPAPRRLAVLSFLNAVAEHADAGRAQARGQLDRPLGLVERAPSRADASG